jgi:thymidylate kinase
LSVALLGPDGAGKSTLAASIQDGFWFPVKSLYMGYRPSAAAGRPALPGMELATRLGSLWWRYLQAQYHQYLGRLVIFDRYTFDALLAPRHGYTWQERLYWGMLGRAIPTPDLVLVLDAPGEVMFARKGEHSPDLLEEQRQRFLALLPQIAKAEVVDVARPEQEVRRDVIGRIWRTYHAHWSGK